MDKNIKNKPKINIAVKYTDKKLEKLDCLPKFVTIKRKKKNEYK